jgi:hypothetical protein
MVVLSDLVKRVMAGVIALGCMEMDSNLTQIIYDLAKALLNTLVTWLLHLLVEWLQVNAPLVMANSGTL